MSIGKAWCHDIGELVDIVQACQLYEGHPDYPRLKGKDLTFHCPDDDCRKSKSTPPIVSAVNYKLERWKREMTPHFRVINLQSHSDCCFIVDRYIALDELEKENDEVIKNEKKSGIKNVRPPAEICVFQPATKDVDSDHLGLHSDVEQEIVSSKPGRERIDHLKRKVSERPTRTRRLYEVVSRYESLSWSDKQVAPLTLGSGANQNYFSCFKPYKKYELGIDYENIFHGYVTVHRHREIHFIVKFVAPTQIDGIKYNGSLYIKHSELMAYRFRNEIIRLFDKVAVDEHEKTPNPKVIHCYFYGKSILKTTNSSSKTFLNIEIDHLHNITFRKIKNKG